ncbi:MAG TPA: anti-sigma factor [Hydrogenophaga sp.]|uniref:anti-sigma factor n=1 Tax=Hydrogenophaga sp. TaxID=1904254 RepID=UPI002C45FC18|nr:anti-sigma factor [Hydrogenophaga sp.]HSX93047.1 anti-sigma factor [Hydrogenophaga sp.]
MRIQHHPELLQRLAAAYALGTLRGGARRRFETIAREQPVVRAAAIEWQTRVASLNELQASAEPGPQVWTRIQNLVRADGERAAIERQRERAATVPARGWWHSLALWRGAGLAGLCAVVAALVLLPALRGELERRGAEVAELQRQLLATPDVRYVAVLNDDQARPAVLITFDPKHNRLSLQRVGAYQEAADRSLQLWALPPGAAPRSLGVLTPERLLQLAASENAVREVPALAISLEPLGGVPSERGPTGPVLFHGPLIQKQI